MLGLSFDKLLIIGIVAVFLLGPERLPYYASQLAKLVRGAKAMAEGAKERMREEMGPDFDEVDWKKLDPRQYDPRRIIREALIDDAPAVAVPVAPVGESAYARRQRRLAEAGSGPGAASVDDVASGAPQQAGSVPGPVRSGPAAGSAAGTAPAVATPALLAYDEEAT